MISIYISLTVGGDPPDQGRGVTSLQRLFPNRHHLRLHHPLGPTHRHISPKVLKNRHGPLFLCTKSRVLSPERTIVRDNLLMSIIWTILFVNCPSINEIVHYFH